MIPILLLTLKIAVMLLTFAIGLGSTREDLAYLWRRPSELVRSLLAMYVVVPLMTWVVVRLLPLPIEVEGAMLVLAISAGAPLLPKKLMKLGREGYVLSLTVTASLLAIIMVPAWLLVVGPHFGQVTPPNAGAVAALIAKAFLAPLLAGMLVRRIIPRVAVPLSEWLLGSVGIVLAVAGIALIAFNLRLVLAGGWVPILALAGMAALGLATGHVLGGPHPQDRTALAVSCASRHIGIALFAASATPGPGTVTLVLAYLLGSALVSTPYIAWRAKAAARDHAAA